MNHGSRFLTAVLLLLTFGAVLPSGTRAGEGKRIAFFTPTSENNTYWPQVYRLVQTVGDDLGLTIDIHEFDVRNRFAKHMKGVKILKDNPKPDAAVFSVAFGNAEPLLEAAESLGIPVFIQGPLFPSELPGLGNTPRNKFKMWIGYFYQDEENKGYLLGKTLISKARSLGLLTKDRTIHVAGIGGDPSWFGSKLREKGLLRAVKEAPDARMLQVVPTRWTEKEAQTMTLNLLNRYTDLSVIWAASDQLGIGAATALKSTGKTMGTDALTGGLDLSMNGLIHVKQGSMAATVASTTLEYAEIVIYLFDYLHGIDFAGEAGTEIQSTLHVVTPADADRFIRLYETMDAIDFAACSKYRNPALTHYDFSLEHLLDF